MLAIWGLLIVVIFMTLIMTKKATPFTSLVLSPVVVAIVAGAFGHLPLDAIAGDALAGVKGVAPTVVMLTFAIFYFGLMLTAGLFDPLVGFILRIVKGDPMRVMIGTALLALAVSMDGDGATTTMVVCTAMIPVYKRLNMKMMDLAVLIIMSNSIMNLLPWGGPTARIIAALGVDTGEITRRIIPGMILASIWVICVAFIRGRAERARLGIVEIDHAALAEAEEVDPAEAALKRPKMLIPNLILTIILMITLIFGGMWFIPKIHASILFEVGFAIALVLNFRILKDQRQIIELHAGNVMQVTTMVMAAGIFMGILNAAGQDAKAEGFTSMSIEMGLAMTKFTPEVLLNSWPLMVALISIPGTFFLSNDAFYMGVLPVLNATGVEHGFEPMHMAIASTTGQAFHLLSPLVGFIYLLINLTGVDMGEWQRTAAKWSIVSFIAFCIGAFTLGGVPLIK